MRERVKPVKEPRKPHGEIHPSDPPDRPEAERQREQQQQKESWRESGASSLARTVGTVRTRNVALDSSPEDVDIGCGTGRFLDFAKQVWPRLPVLGIDLSEALHQARAAAP